MSAPSEMRLLEAAILKNGYKLARTGRGAHKKVLDKHGTPVRDENGPLILSGSPSEHRWREMHVHRLMKAGVLAADPFKGNGKNGSTADGEEDGPRKTQAEQAAERERVRVAEVARVRGETARAASASVRARLEPIVAKLGGWSNGGSGINPQDFAKVVMHWAATRDGELPPRKHGYPDPVELADVRRAVTVLRTRDGTLAAKWLPTFGGFVDFLESESGDPPDPTESSLTYFEILREVKGIGAPPEPEPDDDDRPLPSGFGVHLTPLALDALYLMARGADPGEEARERVLDLARRIARLDTNHDERE